MMGDYPDRAGNRFTVTEEHIALLRRAWVVGGEEGATVVQVVKRGTAPNRYAALKHWCLGCATYHFVPVAGVAPSVWTWNNSFDQPTLNPSLRHQWTEPDGPKCCHYFIMAGMIEYLSDSTHDLAGRTVALPPVDREEREEQEGGTP